jgi:hypothetical protein
MRRQEYEKVGKRQIQMWVPAGPAVEVTEPRLSLGMLLEKGELTADTFFPWHLASLPAFKGTLSST